MGVSTDGILCFGIRLGGPDEEFDHTSELQKLDPEYDKEIDSGSPLEGMWYLQETTKEMSQRFELKNMQHIDCQNWVITLKHLCLTACRGHILTVTPEFIASPTDEDITSLQWFCKKFRIPWAEPKWILGSYWDG